MRYDFYVFSGTGNTRKVCEKIKETLEREGNKCSFNRIARGENAVEKIDGELVIGFPVHAFNAPVPAEEFVKELPDATDGRKTYLFATSGEPLKLNDCAFVKISRVLEEKGYDVCLTERFVMPYNIIFRHSDEMAARMWATAEKGAINAAYEMINGEKNLVKTSLTERAASGAFRIEHAAMSLIGRSFAVTDGCVGCGACAKVCPQKNIVIKDGKPCFGKDCVGCMGCAFSCPTDSIRTGVLNAWRVNGKYDFGAEPAKDEEICKYLRKTYLKYFQNAESVIK